MVKIPFLIWRGLFHGKREQIQFTCVYPGIISMDLAIVSIEILSYTVPVNKKPNRQRLERRRIA